MDGKTMIERLKWLATAEPGTPPPEWLVPNGWAPAISEVAAAALETITTQEDAIERAYLKLEAPYQSGALTKTLAVLRERIIEGGGVGHIRMEELEQFARMQGLYEQLLEEIGSIRSGKAELEALMATWSIHGPQAAWRPIAEAPIPPAEGLPIYWHYRCLIQDSYGNVLAGFARYVDTATRGRSPRVLRWYEGVPQRYAIIENPHLFQPLPQPRKDT